METLRKYLMKNAEQVLALVILVSVPAITYLLPYKLVFLNFFFIVILLAVYFLEAHRALMGGVFTTLLVVIYVYHFPNVFLPNFTQLDLWMNILAWSSFLILTGGAVGKIADRLKEEIKELKDIKQDLEAQNEQLEARLAGEKGSPASTAELASEVS